jgi:hypothetical protein
VTESDFEGGLAKRVVGWLLAVLLPLVFAAGLWAADVRSRIANLETSRLTREEAAALRQDLQLLRQEIGFLRGSLRDEVPR